MNRKWLVFVAVSVMFFFITGTTFKSLGVVLYTMAEELNWSQTQAGQSFSILGMSCCLSSLIPMVLVNRLGVQWTYFIGATLLGSGFLLAYSVTSLPPFLLATGLMGMGFSMCANIPGVYLLARWFPERPGRIIGLYLMFGAFGGVVGPPLLQWIISATSWRELWFLQSLMVALLGIGCLFLIRDRKLAETAAQADDRAAVETGWTQAKAIRTPQFFLAAAAMVVLQCCVTVVQSSAVTHVVNLGHTPLFGAWLLGLQALTASMGKGASGIIGEWVSSRLLLAVGLILESIGMILLAFTSTPFIGYAFFLTFGIGWGAGYLAITVLLIEYFGPRVGSSALSFVWLLTAFATVGPAVAGMIADRFGSFTPAYLIGAGMLVPIAVLTLISRAPKLKTTDTDRTSEPQKAEALVAQPRLADEAP